LGGSTAGLPPFPDRLGHFPADRAELADWNVLQAPPSLIQSLVDLDGGLLHEGVGVLAAAKEDEVSAPRKASVPVVAVEGQTQ